MPQPQAAAQAYVIACNRTHAEPAPELVNALNNGERECTLAGRGRPLTDPDILCIAEALKFPHSLRCLVLEDGTFTENALATLVEALTANPGNLRELRLGKNKLKDSHAQAITKVMLTARVGLKVLDFSENSLTKAGAASICEAVSGQNSDILEVSFHNNALESDAGVALAQAIRSAPKLKHLHLGYNQLKDAGATQLARCLPMAPVLSTLDLTANRIGPQGGQELARALMSETCRLQRLNLRANNLDDETLLLFSEVLLRNTSLTQLYLGYMAPTPETGATVLTSLRHNKNLLMLDIYGWKLDHSVCGQIIEDIMFHNTTVRAITTDACQPIFHAIDKHNWERQEKGLHDIYIGPDDRHSAIAASVKHGASETSQARRGTNNNSRVASPNRQQSVGGQGTSPQHQHLQPNSQPPSQQQQRSISTNNRASVSTSVVPTTRAAPQPTTNSNQGNQTTVSPRPQSATGRNISPGAAGNRQNTNQRSISPAGRTVAHSANASNSTYNQQTSHTSNFNSITNTNPRGQSPTSTTGNRYGSTTSVAGQSPQPVQPRASSAAAPQQRYGNITTVTSNTTQQQQQQRFTSPTNNAAKDQEIARLKARVAELEAQVRSLQAQLGQSGGGSLNHSNATTQQQSTFATNNGYQSARNVTTVSASRSNTTTSTYQQQRNQQQQNGIMNNTSAAGNTSQQPQRNASPTRGPNNFQQQQQQRSASATQQQSSQQNYRGSSIGQNTFTSGTTTISRTNPLAQPPQRLGGNNSNTTQQQQQQQSTFSRNSSNTNVYYNNNNNNNSSSTTQQQQQSRNGSTTMRAHSAQGNGVTNQNLARGGSYTNNAQQRSNIASQQHSYNNSTSSNANINARANSRQGAAAFQRTASSYQEGYRGANDDETCYSHIGDEYGPSNHRPATDFRDPSIDADQYYGNPTGRMNSQSPPRVTEESQLDYPQPGIRDVKVDRCYQPNIPNDMSDSMPRRIGISMGYQPDPVEPMDPRCSHPNQQADYLPMRKAPPRSALR